jgi:hypothetical protein
VLKSIGSLVPATKPLLPAGGIYNLMMRRGVPADIQREVADAFTKAINSAAFKQIADRQFFEIQVITGEEADKKAARLETQTVDVFNRYKDQIGAPVKSAQELGLPAPKDFDKWWPPQGYKPVGV